MYAITNCNISYMISPLPPSAPPQGSVPLLGPTLSQKEPIQSSNSQSQTDVTLYTPDTEPSLQPEAVKRESHSWDSITQANSQKSVETILHWKHSPALIPSSTHKGLGSKKAIKKEPLDSLFEFDLEGKPSFPPAEVKSKHEKKTPLTSTEVDTKPLIFQLRPLKSGPSTLKTNSGNSQPHPEDPSVSALPGVKKELPNMSEVLVPQSVESVQDPSGSILAPSSLTPCSQDVPVGVEGKFLPESDLLLKDKKKKRSNKGEGEKEGLAVSTSASSPKRLRLERGTQRDREQEETKNISGGELFCGVQKTSEREQDSETMTSIGPARNTSQAKPSAPEAVIDYPKLAPNWDTTAQLPTIEMAEEVQAVRTDEIIAPPITPTKASGLTASKRSTKHKVYQSSIPFLSARKWRKRSREDAYSIHDIPFPSSSKHRTQSKHKAPHTCTEATNTLATAADTQKSAHAYSNLTSPFTCLAAKTGGRRTKVQDVDFDQSDDFWNDSEVSRGSLNTEDTLEPPPRTYKPVCIDEGFIHPRVTPKLQVK